MRTTLVICIVLYSGAGPCALPAFGETLPIISLLAPLAPDFDLLPRISDDGPASQRINADLAAHDADRRNDMETLGGGQSYWERSTEVTFLGPLFVGFADYNAYYDDGAAHPDGFANYLTYDLRSGDPVDWVKLLPPDLVSEMHRDSADTYASVKLTALYRAEATSRTTPDCAAAVASTELTFDFSLEARTQSVVMHPIGFAHADRACADHLLIGVRDLRAAGAAGELLQALESSQQ